MDGQREIDSKRERLMAFTEFFFPPGFPLTVSATRRTFLSDALSG